MVSMTEREVLAGTDGFRGQAMLDREGLGIINEETFAGLSAALVAYTKEQGIEGPFVVGMDTRPSGPVLKEAVVAGLRSQGAEVLDVGIAPTPEVQRTALLMKAAGCVAVTASHNKYTDNGWKGMIGAEKPGKQAVEAISERYWDLVDSGYKYTHQGEAYDISAEATEKYILDIVQDVETAFGEKPLLGKRIIVDGAYGAGGGITSNVLHALGAQVYEFACGPDGTINQGVGAADLAGVKEYLAQNEALFDDPMFLGAVSNDGDADRVMALGVRRYSNRSQIVEVNGNHMMWAMALTQPGIVGTEYTNSGLRTQLKDSAIDFEECPNGDVNVTIALKDKQATGQNWTRGGEFTGHLVDTKWLSSGDGPRNAAWFAAWTASKGLNFGEVHQHLPLWHERMTKVELAHKEMGKRIVQSTDMIDLQETIKDAYTEDPVRLVVRPSGTEPVVRIWGESRDITNLMDSMNQLVQAAHNIARNL